MFKQDVQRNIYKGISFLQNYSGDRFREWITYFLNKHQVFKNFHEKFKNIVFNKKEFGKQLERKLNGTSFWKFVFISIQILDKCNQDVSPVKLEMRNCNPITLSHVTRCKSYPVPKDMGNQPVSLCLYRHKKSQEISALWRKVQLYLLHCSAVRCVRVGMDNFEEHL